MNIDFQDIYLENITSLEGKIFPYESVSRGNRFQTVGRNLKWSTYNRGFAMESGVRQYLCSSKINFMLVIGST